MDWLNDFINRFSQFKEIQNLKTDKFFGSIELNFNNGEITNYNLKLHRRFLNQPKLKEVINGVKQ